MSIQRSQRQGEGSTDRIYGVVVGIVTNIDDPDDLGRVKVKFPWLASDQESQWARMCNLLAGPGYGSWFRPAVDTEVLVAFEQGDINYPYVLGMLWNGQDKPPQPTTQDAKDHDKVIKTAQNNLLVFGEDPDGKQYIQLKVKNASNNCAVQLDSDGNAIIEADTITISGGQKVVIKSQSIEIDAGTLKCSGSTSVEIKGTSVDVKSDGILNLKGSLVNIN